MFVVGRVLDPQGRPVPEATVMAYARSKALGHTPSLSRMSPVPIGDARADGSGRFRLDAPRTSSSRYDEFGVAAIAPGYGAAWAELDPDADPPSSDITLRPEYVIKGRFLDIQGRPASGVKVRVDLMGHVAGQHLNGRFVRYDEILYFRRNRGEGVAGWPRPVATDTDGRFTLRGIGRGLRVSLVIDDPRFASQRIEIDTDSGPESRPLTRVLEPARAIEGRVTFVDTGKPAPHALLIVSPLGQQTGVVVTESEADDEGRFRMSPSANDRYVITAYPPPAGQPYLVSSRSFDWPKGAVEHAIDLALPRGVLIRGTVTEEGTGKPIAGAAVRYVPRAQPAAQSYSGSTVLDTADDGTFQVGASPGPGCLFITGPSDDYMLRTVGEWMIDTGQPGGRRYYAHAILELDPKPGIDQPEIHATLRRGATVTGRVVGPDGQPVRDAWMIGRTILQPAPSPWRVWSGDYHVVARDGRFQVHGLDPDAEVPVFFLDPKRKLGATIRLSGKMAAGGPVTVRLEPCGQALARLVGPDGKPVGPDGKPVAGRTLGRFFIIMMVATPGAVGRLPLDKREALADASDLAAIDLINHQDPLASDAQGRVTFSVLIPGAPYRIVDRTTVRDPSGPQIRREFTVAPGEVVDLGDVLIAKPPGRD